VTDIEGKTASGIYFRKTSTPHSRDALVLVMGYAGSGRIWPRGFVDKLAQKYAVGTYDNRGTGYSIVPQDPREYTIKKMSDDLDEVVDQLRIGQLHLLGYSMGSCIALQYAHDHAAKVKTLFLLSGLPAVRRMSGRALRCPRRLLTRKTIRFGTCTCPHSS